MGVAMSDATLPNRPAAEVERLVTAASDALTDSMIERLSTTGANAMEIVDRLNDEATRDAIHAVLDRLTEVHRLGALDTLFQAVTLLHAVRNAATDSIVERLFVSLESTINTIGSEEFATMANNAREALTDATEQSAAAPPAKGGLFSTIALLTKPESQQSLQFLLNFSKALQRRSQES